MKKKVLATLLATAMTVGCLTGCGGGAAEQPAAEAPAAEAPAAEEPAADDAAAEEAPAVEAPATAEEGTDPVATLIAATTGTVTLKVWASEEDQDLTTKLLDDFKAAYPDVTFDITLGAESESTAKDTVLTDVEAAAVDGKVYAYPMTADNGYFMFYDSSVFSESDVQSLEKMIEVADAAGKKIAMDISNGWYIYAFFQGAGLELKLNDDGLTNTCTWNAAGGTDVAQAIIDLTASGVLVDMNDEDMATQIAEGNVAACVNGTWRAETAAEAWGDNYAATKLPTFKAGGKECQMSSYSGYKLVGVNPHSANVGWAMLLAEFLTNESAQTARFEARGLGPSNLNAAGSDAVQANPAIAALAEQAAYATPQRVGGNFWSPAETLGQILASGNPDGTDLQELLDTTVEGITAPVE